LLKDLSAKNFESVFRGTLLQPFLCARTVAKVMMDQKSGNIINISSLAGILGTKTVGAYGACKAGLNNLTQTLSWELAEYNIRVNCLVLGTIITEATHDFFLAHKDIYMGHQLIKRFGEPEDIGYFCVFLASEAASWISGQIYNIDGGKRRFDEVPHD
jgi:3-oxoacyl-[acyl-carrier protein] reductase